MVSYNIFNHNPVVAFFMENATCYKDKKAAMALTEGDLNQVSNNLVSELYKSAINKSHIDFADIPATRGDITKYKGYVDMQQCLDIVDNIAKQSNVKIKETEVVRTALGNIVAMRDVYTKGYALNNDFIMLQYCTMSALCVEATSGIIASFVDYVKTVDNVQFKIINGSTSSAQIAIDNLNSFNASMTSGEYSKICNVVLKNGNAAGIVKESAIVITAAVMTSLVAAVVLMRNVVFRFFYLRMKLSDYLKMQAMFLEMNRANLEAKENKMAPAKRKAVIKKQAELADKLNKMSDKLKVESTAANVAANREIKRENSAYTLDNIKSVNSPIDNIELL